jgi:hypothetical protein
VSVAQGVMARQATIGTVDEADSSGGWIMRMP